MEQKVIIAEIDRLLYRFKSLDKETRKNNQGLQQFLMEQRHSAMLNSVNYFSKYATPQLLYRLKGDDGMAMTIRDYRLAMGDSLELVEGFEPIKVGLSDGSGYIVL